MSLYVVRHQHDAASCPARDPRMGAMLLEHLRDDHARQQGVTIQSKAVVDGAHAVYLIVEADNAATVQTYMQPFAMAGDVEIMKASTCEVVVERGNCDV